MKEATPLALRLWLSKARHNVHCSVNKVIQPTVTEATIFDGTSSIAVAPHLGGHSFLESEAGRRGVVLAVLATILYCCGDLEAFIFPDGEDGTAIVRVNLATLALVLGKVRTEEVCVDASGDWKWGYCVSVY